mmetsp:Transcript_10556/g.25743  ORF Transcript_10556/g.25743 Transcript_10556/m.25743 type:complete len:129 (+) Transcript_10556:906-1292(+)
MNESQVSTYSCHDLILNDAILNEKEWSRAAARSLPRTSQETSQGSVASSPPRSNLQQNNLVQLHHERLQERTSALSLLILWHKHIFSRHACWSSMEHHDHDRVTSSWSVQPQEQEQFLSFSFYAHALL